MYLAAGKRSNPGYIAKYPRSQSEVLTVLLSSCKKPDLTSHVLLALLYLTTTSVITILASGMSIPFTLADAKLFWLQLNTSGNMFAIIALLMLNLALLVVVTFRHYNLIGKVSAIRSRLHDSQYLTEAETSGGLPELDLQQALADEREQSQQLRETVEALEAQLAQSDSQLEVALAARKNFLANMSHELRTPMNGILGMTELLLSSSLNNKQYKFADSVRRSAESLLAVINDLLDYSRIESGGIQLEHTAFSISALVEDVCDLHADMAQRKNLELICHVDRNMHQSVLGDSNRMRQVLSNLVVNAIKFTNSGEVVVRAQQLEGDKKTAVYQFDVVDTGNGITPEAQAMILESFTQADYSASRRHQGVGLGLYISSKLVNMMEGRIQLRSRLGEGSHFTVTLKLEKTSIEKANASLHGSLRGARMLIVDDNDTNRTILYHQLKSWDVIPHAVESGAKALEALDKARVNGTPYDIAILDLHMPGMDGIELSQKIEADERLKSTDRILLTSAALELSKTEMSAIGISQYISKPARQSQLYNALANLLLESGYCKPDENPQDERAYPQVNANVLLAEDNLINQDVALNMLENFGCTVRVVNDGRRAVEAANEEAFDLILMDCEMPVMDGFVATHRLKSASGLNQQTPVIALTANVMDGDRESCIASGMSDYISKPVRQDDLHNIISKWVEIKGNHGEPTDASTRPVEASVSSANEALVEGSTTPALLLDEVETPSLAPKSITADVVAPDSTVSNADSATTPTDVLGSTVAEEQSSEDVSEEAPECPINEMAINNIRKLQRPGRPSILNKVINAYLDKSPSLIDDLKTGADDGNATLIKEAAHSLKSSSAYIGADSLSEKCKQLEVCASDEQVENVGAIVQQIDVDFEKVAAILSELREEA